MENQAARDHGFIGIDFGTSNSHISYCNVDGSLLAVPISLGGKDTSVHTCVLCEPAWEEADIVSFGSEAVQEWLNREGHEAPGPSVRGRFQAGHHRIQTGQARRLGLLAQVASCGARKGSCPRCRTRRRNAGGRGRPGRGRGGLQERD